MLLTVTVPYSRGDPHTMGNNWVAALLVILLEGPELEKKLSLHDGYFFNPLSAIGHYTVHGNLTFL